MKLSSLVVISCLLVPGMAFAQSTPVQPMVEFTLRVTPQEADVIGKALGKEPFNDVALLLQKLRQQIVEQQQRKDEPVIGESGAKGKGEAGR